MEVLKKKIITSNDLGPFMFMARTKAKMTLEYVAQKSGFTSQTVSNLEKNQGSVNVNTLLAIATVIGVKIEVNFEDKNNLKIKELSA
jgi:transcriptional regulator with XRE-family HTH domain